MVSFYQENSLDTYVFEEEAKGGEDEDREGDRTGEEEDESLHRVARTLEFQCQCHEGQCSEEERD